MFEIKNTISPKNLSKNNNMDELKSTINLMKIGDSIAISPDIIKESTLRNAINKIRKQMNLNLRVEKQDDNSCIIFKLVHKKQSENTTEGDVFWK